MSKAIILVVTLLLSGASSAFAKEAIQDPLEGWNELWRELMWDITIIGVVFALITLYLLIRYRRKNPDEQGSGGTLAPLKALGWGLIPAFAFMADDIYLAAKNFELWNISRTPPAGAYEIKVKGYMWGWDVTYPDGTTFTNEMRVPAGVPVKVLLTSRDVVHSFFIPDFRVKWDLVPGRESFLWFYPKEPGEHVMTCAEYCGILHSGMYGKVIVMPEEQFNAWDKEKGKGGAI